MTQSPEQVADYIAATREAKRLAARHIEGFSGLSEATRGDVIRALVDALGEAPELVAAEEIKIKVGKERRPDLTPAEVHASFRLGGFTADAENYPLSDRAYDWLCRFNGARTGETPWTWRYAPNPEMQRYLDDRADREAA